MKKAAVVKNVGRQRGGAIALFVKALALLVVLVCNDETVSAGTNGEALEIRYEANGVTSMQVW